MGYYQNYINIILFILGYRSVDHSSRFFVAFQQLFSW